MGACRRGHLALLLALMASFALGAQNDPGILLEIDRDSFELTVRDLRDGDAGPSLRVTIGTPAHQTPSGSFPLYTVVREPAWKPGPQALSFGARAQPSRLDGPLGVAKLPFGAGGYAVHGGGHPLLLGKPASLGCVRTVDADMLELLEWLKSQRALGRPVPQPSGERHQAFLRPARLLIR